MNDDKKQPGPTERKPYAKPELFVFPLRPTEAVLGNCKMSTSGGVGLAGCEDALGTPCSSIGS